MQVRTSGTAFAVLAAAALAATAPALAHQTVTSQGTSVTFHVTPDDEPIAGQASTMTIVAVHPRGKGSRFTFRDCRCRIRITDSSGRVLRDAAAGKRTTFTFPAPAAYQVTVSGRYRTASKKTRRFSAAFALRAVTGE